MNIGDKVYSRLYSDQGEATVLSFSELFGEEYAEVLFTSSAQCITVRKDDIYPADSFASRMQSGSIDHPELFLVRNMAIRIKAAKSEERLISSANFRIKPLPHQLLTVNFVMNRYQPRSLIADEVGLGKTIEAILVFQEYKLRNMARRILIVVPSGLVLQWQEELLAKFGEQFAVYTREQIKALKLNHGAQTNIWNLNDKIIVSIDTVKPLRIHDQLDEAEKQRRIIHNLEISQAAVEAGFDMVIIDEAHRLTKKGDGSQSARFRFGDLISKSTPIFLLLTATPHQGDEAMFHNLMKLVDPVLFAGRDSLKPQLISEVTVRNRKRTVVDFEGKRIFKQRITSLVGVKWEQGINDQEMELYQMVTEYTSFHYNLALQANNQMMILLVMLYQRILSSSSFALLETMKRRLAFLENVGDEEHNKNDICIDDSETDDNYLQLDMEKALQVQLSKNRKELQKEILFVRSCIEKANYICQVYGDVKLKKLLEIVEEIRKRENDPDLKFIIFTEFRATQDAICSYLERYGFSSAIIHGGLGREQKAEQVKMFRQQRQFLVSTDAGGEGINLQFCYCVINFDLPWNPARLEQRIGRVDRIGQDHNVLVFNMHHSGTIEDHVRSILEDKLERIKSQYGVDKYADVLSALDEEFDFDRIYLDAIMGAEEKNRDLDIKAQQVFEKAKKIIEEDGLLIPFSSFSDNPRDLYNRDIQKIIQTLVFQYLKQKDISVQSYKKSQGLYYFANPFPDLLPHTKDAFVRNATFSSEAAFENDQAQLINLDHPITEAILSETARSEAGSLSAFRLSINKFSGVSGMWFVYELSISNNSTKKVHRLISVFLEDEEFENSRIGNYLSQAIIENVQVIPNFKTGFDIERMENGALSIAQEKSMDIFNSIKLKWLEEFDILQQRTEYYNKIRENAISAISLDNIRESKLRQLEVDINNQKVQEKLKRNIIPRLDLKQIAWVEFA